jgi:hypothetical protein
MGICDVPKHVRDLLMSDVYIFWCMYSWLHKLIILFIARYIQYHKDINWGVCLFVCYTWLLVPVSLFHDISSFLSLLFVFFLHLFFIQRIAVILRLVFRILSHIFILCLSYFVILRLLARSLHLLPQSRSIRLHSLHPL